MNFYETTNYFWAKKLERNWLIIKEEYESACKNAIDYPEPDLYNQGWQVLPLVFFGTEFKENQERCPQTWALVSQIPGLVNASFSILKDGTEIYPHTGFTNKVLRSHLTLKSEASGCSITVGGEERAWKEGEIIIFDDTKWHSAYNKSGVDRVVLIADFQPSQSASHSPS